MKKTVCNEIVTCDRCGRNLEDVDTPFLRGCGSLSIKAIIFKVDDCGVLNDGTVDKYEDLCVECTQELISLISPFMKRKKS